MAEQAHAAGAERRGIDHIVAGVAHERRGGDAAGEGVASHAAGEVIAQPGCAVLGVGQRSVGQNDGLGQAPAKSRLCHPVLPPAAVDEVATRPAREHIGLGGANQRVVSSAATQGHLALEAAGVQHVGTVATGQVHGLDTAQRHRRPWRSERTDRQHRAGDRGAGAVGRVDQLLAEFKVSVAALDQDVIAQPPVYGIHTARPGQGVIARTTTQEVGIAVAHDHVVKGTARDLQEARHLRQPGGPSTRQVHLHGRFISSVIEPPCTAGADLQGLQIVHAKCHIGRPSASDLHLALRQHLHTGLISARSKLWQCAQVQYVFCTAHQAAHPVGAGLAQQDGGIGSAHAQGLVSRKREGVLIVGVAQVQGGCAPCVGDGDVAKSGAKHILVISGRTQQSVVALPPVKDHTSAEVGRIERVGAGTPHQDGHFQAANVHRRDLRGFARCMEQHLSTACGKTHIAVHGHHQGIRSGAARQAVLATVGLQHIIAAAPVQHILAALAVQQVGCLIALDHITKGRAPHIRDAADCGQTRGGARRQVHRDTLGVEAVVQGAPARGVAATGQRGDTFDAQAGAACG